MSKTSALHKQRNDAVFVNYLSSMFCYLEYYLALSQGNVMLNIFMKAMLDPQTYSIIEDFETQDVKIKNQIGIESLSVDEATKSRINKFLDLVGQGEIRQAAELIPSLRASLGIQTPAITA